MAFNLHRDDSLIEPLVAALSINFIDQYSHVGENTLLYVDTLYIFDTTV
jgi:hypothetical protein